MRHTMLRIIFGIVIGIIGIDLVIINVKIFSNASNPKIAAYTAVLPPTITPTVAAPIMCPNNCLTIIREATSSAGSIKPSVPAPIRTATIPTPYIAQVREYFVPLGTGTATNDDWVDVPGAQAMIDSSQYTSIKSVTFEAAVHVPDHNQAVWIRLYNDSDRYIIGGSELYFPDGNVASLLTSGTISLGAGNKLYKVQIKTQLKFPAHVTSSRIRITTN